MFACRDNSGRKSTPQILAPTSHPPNTHAQILMQNLCSMVHLQQYTLSCMLLFHRSPPPHILVIYTHMQPSCLLCSAKHSWMLNHNLLQTKDGSDLFKQTKPDSDRVVLLFYMLNIWESFIMCTDAALWLCSIVRALCRL